MTLASTSLSPAEQDLSAIKTGDWGDREFPLGPRERPTRRQVIFKQSVLNDIYAHGRGAPEIEVCGVLVGNVYQDAQGPFVFVEANIRGNFSSGKAAQVTFTAKTWSHIQDVMDKSYPDMRILGWYHTHPGHGIFLSDMDLFIHKNFFSLPWHLAFVFDPQNQEEGLFAWRTGNMAIESFVVQKDAQQVNPKVARRVPDAPAPTAPVPATATVSVAMAHATPAHTASVISAPPTPSTIAPTPAETQAEPAAAPAAAPMAGPRASQAAEVTELALRIQTLEKRQRWVTVAMALIVLVAIAWPIVLSALAVLQAPGEDPLLPQAKPAAPASPTASNLPPPSPSRFEESAAAEALPAGSETENRP
jgi:proteasome lid subunit RPN8/RPN11